MCYRIQYNSSSRNARSLNEYVEKCLCCLDLRGLLIEQTDPGELLELSVRLGQLRSRKAFVSRLRRITIRRKEGNQTFDEEIS